MASLRKRGQTRFWFACYSDQNGRRVQRSTKQTDKRKAQEVANAFAKAARMASTKRLGEAQARRILSELYESVSGTPLPSASTKDYLTTWASSRKNTCAPSTHAAYTQVARDFLASLGPRAHVDISTLTRADVVKFRDEVLARTTVSTANKSVKYLRVALGSAWKDGLSQDNPAAKVDALTRSESTERRPFTLDEIKAMLANADDEWKGIILFGLYSGQRLKDIGSAQRQSDFDTGDDLKPTSIRGFGDDMQGSGVCRRIHINREGCRGGSLAPSPPARAAVRRPVWRPCGGVGSRR